MCVRQRGGGGCAKQSPGGTWPTTATSPAAELRMSPVGRPHAPIWQVETWKRSRWRPVGWSRRPPAAGEAGSRPCRKGPCVYARQTRLGQPRSRASPASGSCYTSAWSRRTFSSSSGSTHSRSWTSTSSVAVAVLARWQRQGWHPRPGEQVE